MIILRYRQTPHYNRSVFRMVLAMDSIMLWACIVACTHAVTYNLFLYILTLNSLLIIHQLTASDSFSCSLDIPSLHTQQSLLLREDNQHLDV